VTRFARGRFAAINASRASRRGVGRMSRYQFWLDKILTEGHHRVVFAGDSRVFRGIAPEEVARTSGIPTREIVNFGFSGTGYGKQYMERVGELLGPGSIAVLGVHPGSFVDPALQDSAFLGYERAWGRMRHDWFQRAKHVIERTLAAVVGSPELDSLDERQIRELWNPANYRRRYQHFSLSGWVATRGRPVNRHFYDEHFHERLRAHTVRPEALEEFLAWIETLRSRDVQVYALRMPVAPNLLAVELADGSVDWARFRDRVARSGARWIDPPADSFDTYDGSHLVSEDARRFSADLGRVLVGDSPW